MPNKHSVRMEISNSNHHNNSYKIKRTNHKIIRINNYSLSQLFKQKEGIQDVQALLIEINMD